MGRRTAASGVSAPAGGIVHAGCAPHFLFETSKRKCAAPGGKEKMFGGSVCAGADLLPPAGEGWHSRVEVRDGNALPLGKAPSRGSLGYILRRFSLPLALPHGSVSGSEKRSRGNTTTTPTPSAPSAMERQYLPRRRVKRARRRAKIGAGTDPPTPVRTEGHRTGVRPSGLFFWTVHRAAVGGFAAYGCGVPLAGTARFLFGQGRKENGGCIAQLATQLNFPGGRLPPLRRLPGNPQESATVVLRGPCLKSASPRPGPGDSASIPECPPDGCGKWTLPARRRCRGV